MKTLIVYGTNSGGTEAVASIVGEVMRRAGHSVTIHRASEPAATKFVGHDLIVLGSCTWERLDGKDMLDGQLQQHMFALVKHLRGQAWPKQRFAIFGLGDSSYTHFCRAADFLEAFVRAAKGKLIIPTLRIDGFFFDLEKNRRLAHDWARQISNS